MDPKKRVEKVAGIKISSNSLKHQRRGVKRGSVIPSPKEISKGEKGKGEGKVRQKGGGILKMKELGKVKKGRVGCAKILALISQRHRLRVAGEPLK